MIPTRGDLITELVRENFDACGLAKYGMTTDVSVCFVTPRFDTSRHVIGLIFSGSEDHPRLVAKVPRQPFDNEGVQREADMVRALHDAATAPVFGVPAIIGVFDRSGHSVLIETAITSRPLEPDVVAEDPGLAIRAGVAFVTSLPVTATAEANAGWYDRTITEPLADLQRAAPMAGLMERLVAQTHTLLEPIRNEPLPAVFEHADLSHPNLFLSAAGHLEVIDWERTTRRGVPGHDLVFLLQHLSESSRHAYLRPDQGAALDAAFLDPGAWAPDLLRRYLAGLGVSADMAPYLLLATWARSTATLVARTLPAHLPPDRPEPGAGGGGLALPDISAVVERDRDFWLWKHVLERYADGIN